MADPLNWFFDIPPVSRCFLAGAILVSTACYMDIVSPLSLYFNYELIFNKGQYWRIFTSFFFFGQFSIDFLFHLYFVIRYCRFLEEGLFRNRSADLIYMLIVGAAIMVITTTLFPTFATIKFLGHPLSFMMVYVWGRAPENAHVRLGFLGIFPFSAPYLPWVLLLFSMFIGNPVETDFLGIIAGHIYYFLAFVYPAVADIRHWQRKKLLYTPRILHYLCGSQPDDEEQVHVMEEPINIPEAVQPAEEEQHFHND